jgi:hypothetical protein
VTRTQPRRSASPRTKIHGSRNAARLPPSTRAEDVVRSAAASGERGLLLLPIRAGRGAVGLAEERVEVGKIVQTALQSDIGDGAVGLRVALGQRAYAQVPVVNARGRARLEFLTRLSIAGDLLCLWSEGIRRSRIGGRGAPATMELCHKLGLARGRESLQRARSFGSGRGSQVVRPRSAKSYGTF